MVVTLFPFGLRNRTTGKWYRARWKGPPEEIERNGWVVDGLPVTYASLGPTSGFQSWQPPGSDGQLAMHPRRESPPGIDETERFLVGAFLRRYATYRVRRGCLAYAHRIHRRSTCRARDVRHACSVAFDWSRAEGRCQRGRIENHQRQFSCVQACVWCCARFGRFNPGAM